MQPISATITMPPIVLQCRAKLLWTPSWQKAPQLASFWHSLDLQLIGALATLSVTCIGMDSNCLACKLKLLGHVSRRGRGANLSNAAVYKAILKSCCLRWSRAVL